ncbi:MAG TPA: hypothetical protein VF131_18785 [Blastocatellia bacterium]|nr:hypothetical protein [Blastocatellia bacterium]
MNKRPFDEQPENLPVPDGQERLATQAERDDVNEKIESSDSTPVKTTCQPTSQLGASSNRDGGKHTDGN